MGQRRERIIKTLAQAILYPSIAMLSRIDNVKNTQHRKHHRSPLHPHLYLHTFTIHQRSSSPHHLSAASNPTHTHARTHANNALPTIHQRPPLHRHLGTSQNPHAAPASHIRYEEPSRFGTRVRARRADAQTALQTRPIRSQPARRVYQISRHISLSRRAPAGLLRGACRLG